ncbi:MAG: dihydroorotase [Chloroflexi bacterium]|nr:dihydroorotase [Chloroflexota bacterium]
MQSSPILIKGPRIIDASSGLDQVGDILVVDGMIAAVGPISQDGLPDGCRTVDATGLVACPGFIDLHCHLREPGFEFKETIASGTRAAAKGGFTSICAMPNTDPPVDNAAVVDFLRFRSQAEAAVRVFPIACVSKGRLGRELADMEELASAGAVAFSDDGDPVYDANLMRLALAYSLDLGLPITNHCQDIALSRNGVMAEGAVASRLGLDGIPAAAEEAMIARDISLAELTGGRLHIAHVSTAGSVPLLRQAKERGLRVTAEVCPHHLTITDQWVLGGNGMDADAAGPLSYDTSTKVYPPLRTQRDVDALVQALAEGVIDCIATDHAPHDATSKQCTYQEAAFGISVLETALGSTLQMVHQGLLSLPDLVHRWTVGPASVLGSAFDGFASLDIGTPADVVLFDPDREWVVNPQEFLSQGKNTPLAGVTLKGQVVATFVDGRMVYESETSKLGAAG